MSRPLIARSPDLQRLRDEGYDVQIVGGHVILRDVPYLDAHRRVQRGILISTLTLANDVTTRPDSHVAMFCGGYPHHPDGQPIDRIRNGEVNTTIGEGIVANFTFSAKPLPKQQYDDYYAKMTTYAAILSGPAEAVDPKVSPKTFRVRPDGVDDVFKYVDTASSRAQLNSINAKLASHKVAILGLGGTGSYVLDLVAKTWVREIHLMDGDVFQQHNAFRAPGAATGEDLDAKLPKVRYFERKYSAMRNGIVAHEVYATPDNLALIAGVDFVFLCMEGAGKKAIVRKLEEMKMPFIDVGMGVYVVNDNDSLGGILRVTTSTPDRREHVWQKQRIPFSEAAGDNEYDRNIQIADLNALNAALAVIKWKKLAGFYLDQEHELYSTYTIGGNDVDNQDA